VTSSGGSPSRGSEDRQLGVHHVADDVLAVGVRAVDDEDARVDADLVGRQAHTVGGLHDANMSRTRRRRSLPNAVTGAHGRCSTGLLP
jgi:hypothetical protein